MKVYLLMKQVIKENYKYLLTLLIAYGFLIVLFHVGNNEDIKFVVIQILAYILTLGNAVILPNLLFKNYYHQTNASHVASIPMKRLEVFASLYAVGLGISVALVLGYSTLTTLLASSVDQFVAYSSMMLVAFLYYYHLSLFAFYMCGHILFEVIVIGVLTFGPFIAYMVYNWALSTYDASFYVVMAEDALAKLLPFIGGVTYFFFEKDASHLYSLYLILSIIFIVLTLMLVQKRPNERVGQSMMFKYLSYIVRSVTVLLGLGALYAIFGSILEIYDYTAHLFVCTILGIMTAYIVEMFYKKKTRVFHSIKYGILAAIVVFGSVHLGAKAIEGYIPRNFDAAYFEVNHYYIDGYHEHLYIEDPALLETIASINETLMESGVENFEWYGNITIQYAKDNGNVFFARHYDFTKEMFERLYQNESYRPLLVQAMTTQEAKILKHVEERKPITFKHGYGEDDLVTYTLDTEAEFYVFENYLKQEIEAFANQETFEYDLDKKDNHYFEYVLQSTWEAYAIDWVDSELVYNALAKTFKF